MPHVVYWASALAVAVLLVGCSDDDAPADDRPDDKGPDRALVESGLTDLYAGDHATDQETEAGACFATNLVDLAGMDLLLDAGVISDSGEVADELPTFDAELARRWVDAQFACVDYVEESTRALLLQTKGELDSEMYAACLRSALTEKDLRAAVEATLTGAWDAPEVATLADAQARCRQRATS